MSVAITNENDQVVVRTTRVLPQPKNKDLGQRFATFLGRRRRHKKKWPEPSDAFLIFNLHFAVNSSTRGIFHAEATLEIPTENGADYFSIVRSATNRHDALILVIQAIENSMWFATFKKKRIYLRVTGCEMENLYRGYL